MQNAAAVRETVQCKIILLVSSFLTRTTGELVVTPNTGSFDMWGLFVSTWNEKIKTIIISEILW